MSLITTIKLANLEIGQKPLIAAVIPGEKFLKLAKRAKKIGADLFELRIDRFNNLKPNFLVKTINELKAKTKLPIIATIRHRKETDFSKIKHYFTEEERLFLFHNLIPIVDGVDIELQAKKIISQVINFAKEKNKIVIVSYHNFQETPLNKKLESIVKEAKSSGADIAKLAVYAKNINDLARLMFFTYTCPIKPLISISLGKVGAISRIIAPIFGSCLTYAFVNEPKRYGQFELKDLVKEIKCCQSGVFPIEGRR